MTTCPPPTCPHPTRPHQLSIRFQYLCNLHWSLCAAARLDGISLVADNTLAKVEKLEAKATALEAENDLLKANNSKIIPLEECIEERTVAQETGV